MDSTQTHGEEGSQEDPVMALQKSLEYSGNSEVGTGGSARTAQDTEDRSRRHSTGINISRQNSQDKNQTARESVDWSAHDSSNNVNLNRQSSFEDAISYPRPKEGSRSPIVPTGQNSLVTPDEVFGPMSPRRSTSLDDMAARRATNNASANGTRQSSKVVRSNSRRYSRAKTLSPSDEAPLRSMSRFEPVNRYEESNNSTNNTAKGPNIGNNFDNISKANVTESPAVPTNANGDVNWKSKSTLSRHTLDGRSETTLTAGGSSGQGNENTNRHMASSVSGVDESSGILNTTTVSIERNKFTNQLYSSKVDRRYVSRLNALSRGSSYYHGDYVDDNLLISATKLDSTLIRLFSDPNPQDKKYREQSDNVVLPYVDYAQSDLISMDPIKWRVQPMRASHKEALDHELSFIEENLTPRDVIKKLYEEDAITLMDYNQLTRTEGQGEKAVTRLLVRTLQRRGHKAYPAFVRALEDFGYNHVSNKLNETELVIRTGMEKDREDYERNSRMERLEHQNAFNYDKSYFDKTFIYPRRPVGSSDPVIRTSSQAYASPGMKHDSMVSTHSPLQPPASAPNDNRPLASQADSLPEKGINSKELEEQLQGLNAELKALHDDVTALKTSRRQSQGALKSSEEVKTDPPSKAQKSGSCTLL